MSFLVLALKHDNKKPKKTIDSCSLYDNSFSLYNVIWMFKANHAVMWANY